MTVDVDPVDHAAREAAAMLRATAQAVARGHRLRLDRQAQRDRATASRLRSHVELRQAFNGTNVNELVGRQAVRTAHLPRVRHAEDEMPRRAREEQAEVVR